MGILNASPDSFSGDGVGGLEALVARAGEMIADGSDILDVGGESARANRPPISVDEEIARLRPFVEKFSQLVSGVSPRDADQIFPPLLSVNTWRPEVAGPLLAEGADLLNDIGALPTPENARLAAEHGAALLLMHSVGAPKVPHTNQTYPDVLEAMDRFFEEKIAMALAAGLDPEALILDPGIDFAKQFPDNLRVYRHISRLQRFGRPILLPVSRKTTIGRVLGIPDPRERDAGTIACIVRGIEDGAQIFRVHNVRAAFAAVKVLHAVGGGDRP